MTAIPKKSLLSGQKAPPASAGDVSDYVIFDDGVVGVASIRGGRGYQEDRFLVSPAPVASRDARAFLAGIFAKAAKKTDGCAEGSTGTALVISDDLKLNAAFLGDSPVVVFVHDPATGDVTAKKLTRDHHAREPSEKARIEREGGRVARNGRVDGDLMLSRAFGDARFLGVSQDPEFAAADLKKDIDAGRDVYVCISSDGLFETLEPEDYAAPLKKAIAQKKEAEAANIFAAHAHAEGSRDNITALVVKVPAKMKTGLFLAIADGHGGDETSQKVIDSFRSDVAARKPPKR